MQTVLFSKTEAKKKAENIIKHVLTKEHGFYKSFNEIKSSFINMLGLMVST